MAVAVAAAAPAGEPIALVRLRLSPLVWTLGTMDDTARILSGRPLRYLLTETIWERGPSTVGDLVARVAELGLVLPGRPSKVVSDELRWEIARGRVQRLGRGRYGPGAMPRQTRAWIRARVRSIVDSSTDRADSSSGRDGISLGGSRPVP